MISDQYMHLAIVVLLIVCGVSLNTPAMAQCNLNSCGTPASLSANAPVFNSANRSIQINNITFANAACNAANFILGIDFYVYQLLPNGNRIINCNVLNPFPNNTLGVVHLDMGNTSICDKDFEIDNFIIDANNGFEICDGARYEIEMALYTTTNLNFKNLNKTVDAELNSSEYKLVNLGVVETNISNTFSNGQPIITTEISNWASRSNSTIVVPCNQNVDIYVQGQSVIANCAPFNNFSNAIPSEMVNTFSYSVNGGVPVIIENSSTGASGGQLTGAINSIISACYGGIMTDKVPYTFEASNLANACGGTTVKFIINTTDVFTGLSKSADYTIIYGNCVPVLTVNNSSINNSVYAASQMVNSTGNIANNGNVVFRAGEQICLNNRFSVPVEANFTAEIGACQ